MSEEQNGGTNSASTVFRRLQPVIDDLADTSGKPRWNPAIDGLVLGLFLLGIVLWQSVHGVWAIGNAIAFHRMAWILLAAELVIGSWQAILLNRYKLRVQNKIRQSGIVEKLALGYDALPDIHSRTPFPINRLLGPRPVTIRQSLKFIANHISWYAGNQEATYWGGLKGAWVFPALLLMVGALAMVLTGTVASAEFMLVLLMAMSVFVQQFIFLQGKNAYGRAAFFQELKEMKDI